MSGEVAEDLGDDAVRLGAWLRRIRRQKNMTLRDVQDASGNEFKASVLGAYERGERMITVRRLQRLAHLYRVPVDQMVPAEGLLGGRPSAGDEQAAHAPDMSRRQRPTTIDLTALDRHPRDDVRLLARYLQTIELDRGDFNSRMLTVRQQDLSAMACFFDCHPDQVPGRLDELGLTLHG